MAKKKGIIWKILLFVMLDVLFFAALAPLFKDSSHSPTDKKNKTINERLETTSGEFVLNVNGVNDLILSEEGNTTLGTNGTSSITIDGGSGATIVLTGVGRGTVIGNTGRLIFKNITFRDERTLDVSAWWSYVWFDGNVMFENCKFLHSIYLDTNAFTYFENCEFYSTRKDCYSVWVSGLYAAFENCTFSGYRGLKIHEFEGGADVDAVTVNACKFKNLSAKPGIVIGEFLGERYATHITVTNSTFTRCYPWDRVGSLCGIDGFYESDTVLYDSRMVFKQEGNSVDFVSPTFAIEYVGVEKGDYKTIYPVLWKDDGNYPTSYVFGEGCKVDDLEEIVWVGEREDRAFHGWYLDKECTIKFNGTISETTIGTVTLYGKISAGRWTNAH